jgi:hypothetical protein
MEAIILKVLPYLLGGIGGSGLTIFINWYKNKIQKLDCIYIDEDVMSKLPITVPTGETHNNIYTKQFEVVNTTNFDIKEFRLIFEFDATAKILKHTDISKSGADKFKKKSLKDNEYSVIIKNFNRKDRIKFIFEIANITNNYINVTEDFCIGFKVRFKDKRCSKERSKLTFVSKEQINSN